jgi:outer membrane receptor protein involved in Fe transport
MRRQFARLVPVLFASAAGMFGTTAFAEQGEIEEVVVTGSYIRGTPEDAASPVDVTTREDMDLQGNPSVVDMLRNMGPMAGMDGETNQFQSNGLEGISNVNLRGLGAGRTLVLMNGSRIVPSPFFVGQDGQQFVNTNIIPVSAIGRVEVLKDGASATYGSDAVAGVVNFITRSDFRGIEFQGAYKGVDDADDDDYDASGIVGFGTDRLDMIVAGGYQFRGKLQAREKDWALNPFTVNRSPGGFSFIGSPGTYYPLDGAGDPGSLGTGTPDPDCETVGGTLNGPYCRFRYTDFDNIVEEEKHWQIYSEATYEITDTMTFNAEFLYARDEVKEWNTSPSYPPQALLAGDTIVSPGMPHFDDFIARNPGLAGDFANGALVQGRTFGVSGPAQEGNREYDTYRFNMGLEGEFNSIGYITSLTYGKSEGDRFTNDTRTDNSAYAYRGLGGASCDRDAYYADPAGSGIVPGQGDCEYYNPFTSGFAVSQAAGFEGTPSPGGDNAELNNSAELFDWLVEPVGSKPETEQWVFDLILNGDTDLTADGGAVSWAAGVQYRYDEYDNKLASNTDLSQQACAFGLDGAGDSFTIPDATLPSGQVIPGWTYDCLGAGAFNFLAASEPFKDDQDVYAAFGELSIPFTENLEVQIAARYENYGGDVGDTLDPKIAARWDVLPTVTLRGSLSSSFRAPTLNQLGGEFTALSFVNRALAFKAIDTQGNPNLDPEKAISSNLGVIWQPNDVTYISVDYWNFDFSDPIVIESFEDVVSNCFDATSDIQDVACEKITFQTPGDTTTGIQRIAVDYQNGPDIETSGIDYVATYDFITNDWGMFTLGTEGTYVAEYEVDDWVWSEGFGAEGRLNASTSTVRPIVELKNNAYVNWSMNNHNLRLEWFYTSEYDDERGGNVAGVAPGTEIDDQSTFNVHYNFRFNSDNTRLFASIYNFTDEDPPLTLLDLNYDPYTHSAMGIMWKLGVQHRFEGGIFQ